MKRVFSIIFIFFSIKDITSIFLCSRKQINTIFFSVRLSWKFIQVGHILDKVSSSQSMMSFTKMLKVSVSPTNVILLTNVISPTNVMNLSLLVNVIQSSVLWIRYSQTRKSGQSPRMNLGKTVTSKFTKSSNLV